MLETKEVYSLIIIDDEDIIRSGLSRFGNWGNLGFTVAATFEDGKEALEYLKENQVDAILTDIRMAEVSGLDLAERIREEWPDIYVIIMSGYQEFEYARRALQFSVFDYLLKPIEMDTLYNTFKSLYIRIGEDRAINRIRTAIPDIESFLREKLKSDSLDKNPKLKDLLSEIPDIGEEGSLSDKQEYSRILIEKTQSYVDKHYKEDISLKDVSDHVYLCPAYFCRLFKELTEVNFLPYLTSVRMQKAEELLKSREHKINEIGLMVGYGNSKYFTRVFKKHFNITPTEFIHRDIGGK